MNIAYFTLGESLSDIEVRTQLLRIPEVLSDLRQAQSVMDKLDLLSLMGSQESFMKAPVEFRLKLAQLVQGSLFNRWKMSGTSYDLVLERRKFTEAAEWRKTLKEVLQQKSELHFYVFGPGFDNLEYEISKILFKDPPQVFLHEMISEDPQLEWFWPTIMQDAKLSA